MHAIRAAQLATSLTGAIVANTKTPRAGRYAFRVETVAPAPQAKLVLAGDTQAETDEWVGVLVLAGANSTYDGNKTSRRGSSLSTAVRAISSSMSGHEEQQAMLGNSMRSDAAPPPPAPPTNGALKIDMAAAARMATPALKKTPSRMGSPPPSSVRTPMAVREARLGDEQLWLRFDADLGVLADAAKTCTVRAVNLMDEQEGEEGEGGDGAKAKEGEEGGGGGEKKGCATSSAGRTTT